MEDSSIGGFIDSYIEALEENSKEISDVLEALSNRKLTGGNKKQIASVNRVLKKLDKDISRLTKQV